jgi:hypothetical protein
MSLKDFMKAFGSAFGLRTNPRDGNWLYTALQSTSAYGPFVSWIKLQEGGERCHLLPGSCSEIDNGDRFCVIRSLNGELGTVFSGCVVKKGSSAIEMLVYRAEDLQGTIIQKDRLFLGEQMWNIDEHDWVDDALILIQNNALLNHQFSREPLPWVHELSAALDHFAN